MAGRRHVRVGTELRVLLLEIGDSVSKKMMVLLASVVVVVLGAAATALAASPSASNSAQGQLRQANKDFAGLVDIGGGREMYMECRGKGRPTVVFVSGAKTAPKRGARR